MKVSKEQMAANRERILGVAAQLFRERGFDGIGVSDLMKNAGLTHGGFYGHFSSKEDLMVHACERAHASKVNRWQKLADTSPDTAVATIIADYLKPAHRDAPGRGCMVAALAAEAPRQGPSVKHAITSGAQAQIKVLTDLMPDDNEQTRKHKALTIYASLVGALIMSRAVDDPALSADFLKAMAEQLPKLPEAG